MGSMISLSAGRIDIDWGKNEFFINHLDLFQAGDEGVNDYDYVAENGTPIVESQPCLGRALARVKPRLDMLGYTSASLEARLADWFGEDDDVPRPSLEAFKHALRTIDWRQGGEAYVDFDEAIRIAYARAPESSVLPSANPTSIAFERLIDPYLILRVLADMEEFADLQVCWNFADVREGGYVDDSCFEVGPPSSRWMVVTEGSSDTFVLQRALQKTHPDIADFFDFIDMSTGNPFPGVGNLVTFCKGLSRIRYTGNMLLVLDNDTAGRKALMDIQALGLHSSVVVTCLPELEQLCRFKTWGPSGEGIEDVNGRASAIECFLDLSGRGTPPAIRWTSYVPQLQQYQGELVAKDDYVADFKERALRDGSYDWSKLRLLWQHLVGCCTSAAKFVTIPAAR
ncbi:MAG: HEPN/Toprim-associated domain-containing protein [Giesbergeria sp.]